MVDKEHTKEALEELKKNGDQMGSVMLQIHQNQEIRAEQIQRQTEAMQRQVEMSTLQQAATMEVLKQITIQQQNQMTMQQTMMKLSGEKEEEKKEDKGT
jgi:hypothetical protein